MTRANAQRDPDGPASGDGIDREHPVWTVHEWRSGTKESVVRHLVATAYYVGTHR